MNPDSNLDPNRHEPQIDPAAEYVEQKIDELVDRETIRTGFVEQFADEFGSDRIDAIFDEYYSVALKFWEENNIPF